MDPPIGKGFSRQQVATNTTNLLNEHSKSRSKSCLNVSNSRNTRRIRQAADAQRASPRNNHAQPEPRRDWRCMHNVRGVSVLVCIAAIVALNNLGALITTTAAQTAQRENTRVLPLRTGKCVLSVCVYVHCESTAKSASQAQLECEAQHCPAQVQCAAYLLLLSSSVLMSVGQTNFK